MTPSTDRMTSERRRPACSAGPFSTTLATLLPYLMVAAAELRYLIVDARPGAVAGADLSKDRNIESKSGRRKRDHRGRCK